MHGRTESSYPLPALVTLLLPLSTGWLTNKMRSLRCRCSRKWAAHISAPPIVVAICLVLVMFWETVLMKTYLKNAFKQSFTQTASPSLPIKKDTSWEAPYALLVLMTSSSHGGAHNHLSSQAKMQLGCFSPHKRNSLCYIECVERELLNSHPGSRCPFLPEMSSSPLAGRRNFACVHVCGAAGKRDSVTDWTLQERKTNCKALIYQKALCRMWNTTGLFSKIWWTQKRTVPCIVFNCSLATISTIAKIYSKSQVPH